LTIDASRQPLHSIHEHQESLNSTEKPRPANPYTMHSDVFTNKKVRKQSKDIERVNQKWSAIIDAEGLLPN